MLLGKDMGPDSSYKKGKVGFDVKSNEYDVFHKDHIYTTVFYDKHRDNGVKSLLQVSEKMENRLRYQYVNHLNYLQRVLSCKILTLSMLKENSMA